MKWTGHLVAALGYHELGMHQEGLNELGRLPEADRDRLEVILLRVSILQSMKNWTLGAEMARKGVVNYPDAGDLYIVGAYCIRRAEELAAAFDFLESGAECLANEPCYWFNLGCYHCQLGRQKASKECVKRAIEMDRNYRKLADEDDDLIPLRESWTF
jgi:tetratricopeptide (TPR) repeat protein